MMSSIHLFQHASERMQWLGARQSAVAENIANANTPGYRAVDVGPFDSTLANTALAMTRSSAAHLSAAGEDSAAKSFEQQVPWEVTHSGNSVSVEQELMKAGEVHREFSLTSAIIKAHHRMLMAGVKG